MDIETKYISRFSELAEEMMKIRIHTKGQRGLAQVDFLEWQKWVTKSLHLIESTLGSESDHYKNLRHIWNSFSVTQPTLLEGAKGILLAAKSDFEDGFIFSIEKSISGEIFGDFIRLAKEAMDQENKDVAAVLACAALEDSLQKYALRHGLEVNDKTMSEVINALKSNNLVSGTKKSLLERMPKIRNLAMHAKWEKIRSEDVSAVIGYVERFLLNEF